ncbi:MAG: hypothetical protein GXY48_05245 [Methanomicrobiales archaeon]|nr:hypothetical protein [Methanomicrobiales archaeon]
MISEEAVSEIISAILLISILVAAFGIFAALYIPTLVPEKIPRVSLSIACSNVTDPPDIEYSCTRGSFSCKPFDYETCENDCKWRDYSFNSDVNNDRYQDKIYQCMENCIKPICSNLNDCKTLYICHNSGDSLQLKDVSVVVNGNSIIEEGLTLGVTWQLKEFESDNFINIPSTPSPTKFFENGDSLRILNPSGGQPIDVVMIVYTLPSGGKVNLIMNQFGTDVE